MNERLDKLVDSLCSACKGEAMSELRSSLRDGLQFTYPRRYEPKPRHDLVPKPAWHDYQLTAQRIGAFSALHAAARCTALLTTSLYTGQDIISALGERRMDTSTFTFHNDGDIRLVGSEAAVVNVSAVCELAYLLDEFAATVFTRSPVRASFKRWVLDGHFWDATTGIEVTATAEEMAGRILAPERVAVDLVSAVAAITLEPPAAFAFDVNNCPLAVLDKIEQIVAAGGELPIALPGFWLPHQSSMLEQATRRIIPELSPSHIVIPIKMVR